MALLDFTPERREVIVKGKPLFTVEGLSLDGLALLVRTHMPDLEAVFDLLMAGDEPSDPLGMVLGRISTGLAVNAPGLTANMIAVASGEPMSDALISRARHLPFPVQVDALIKIGELTFEENGGVKKSIESLMSLLLRLRVPKATQVTQKPRSSGHIRASAAT